MRSALATLCTLILPGIAWATCADEWRQIGADLMSVGLTSQAPVGLVRQLSDARCRASGIQVMHGRKSRTDIGTLTWRIGDFGLTGDRTFPHRLSLEARDVRLRSDFGDAERNRRLGGLWSDDTPPADLDIAWDWDADARSLRLNGLSIAFTTGDRIFVSGVFDSVDLSTKATTQMAASGWAASSLTISAELRTFLASEIARATLRSDTGEITEFIEASRAENFSDGSREALKQMLAHRSDLQGRLDINLTSEPGVGPVRFLPFALGMRRMEGPRDFWSVMDGVVFDISYERL